ncbi:MAG: hypothetical protein R3D68_07050 [Hyphomicrobiaceae bacterium]
MFNIKLIACCLLVAVTAAAGGAVWQSHNTAMALEDRTTAAVQHKNALRAAERADLILRVKRAAARMTPDPESVKFRNVHVVYKEEKPVVICGIMNPKNRFGAYVGEIPFIGIQSEGRVYLLGGKKPSVVAKSYWHDYCSR